MNLKEIKEILASHKKWLNGEEDGHRADLRGVDLRGIDLRGVNLRGVDLREADLTFTDLTGAVLINAVLINAVLINAVLTNADLTFTDLTGAVLTGADLRGAVLPRNLKLLQSGQWTAIVMPDVITIGCQRHGVARWREFSDEEIVRMHPNALAWWRGNKALVMAIHASLEVS